MKTWFVSRHLGALHWMQQNNIHFDEHVAHLDPTLIQAGDVIIGSLPINLAAQICSAGAAYWNLSLCIPAHMRGKELSAEDLRQFGATLERYEIVAV